MSLPVYLITDYKGNFGSKYNAVPYRSGFNKTLLADLFRSKGYDPVFINPSLINLLELELKDAIVLYTSQEDYGLFYKGFLEDVVFSLELRGVRVVPSFSLLRAHENKVFFEMLRKATGIPQINNLKSLCFGTLEEYYLQSDRIRFPAVVKIYHGSKSRGVYLVGSGEAAEKKIKKITRTPDIILNTWDYLRSHKHTGYIRDSLNRKKFIIQDFVPDLVNDYKVLIFGSKYYVLKRGNKAGDFRASGQGMLSFQKDLPEGLLDFSEKCHLAFNSPHSSLDIGFNGKEYFLFEAQFLYFGTYTLEYSDFYFTKENERWMCKECKSCLEEEYVSSILRYISD